MLNARGACTLGWFSNQEMCQSCRGHKPGHESLAYDPLLIRQWVRDSHCRGQNDFVDPVNDAIFGDDVGLDDLGIVDHDGVAIHAYAH